MILFDSSATFKDIHQLDNSRKYLTNKIIIPAQVFFGQADKDHSKWSVQTAIIQLRQDVHCVIAHLSTNQVLWVGEETLPNHDGKHWACVSSAIQTHASRHITSTHWT